MFIIGPAIVVAAAIALDNRLRGPYFAIVDVVFGDFGSGYHWYDKEILLSFVRRVAYIIGVGLLLNAFHYRLIDVAAVFLVAGFLMIWPAFGHPLPVPARKSDWHVLAVWAAYVASVVLFGLFGARSWALIGAISGDEPWKFMRGSLLSWVLTLIGALLVTAFRARAQTSIWNRDKGGERPAGRR
ncbi:hypothetical protein ACT18_24930 [Mycolicibacter kumamotonensis]|uniref:Uncharacterized protein n=1 Tax=Mycolicibacter kumamotonensis TaxID=354243 RepID=A0A1B8S8P8_9MYCO|nr:hypothetical protein ACT18_24930 [Mycolicibacter kumamotonensis]